MWDLSQVWNIYMAVPTMELGFCLIQSCLSLRLKSYMAEMGMSKSGGMGLCSCGLYIPPNDDDTKWANIISHALTFGKEGRRTFCWEIIILCESERNSVTLTGTEEVEFFKHLREQGSFETSPRPKSMDIQEWGRMLNG